MTNATSYQTNLVLYHMQIDCIYVAPRNLLLGSLTRILFFLLLLGYVRFATLSSDNVRLCPIGFFLSPAGFFPPYGRAFPPPSVAVYRPARTDLRKMLPQPDANPLLEAFLSDPEQAVIGFGLDGAIFLWNQTAEVLFGFTQTEVLGKSVSFLLALFVFPAHEEFLLHPSPPYSRNRA